MAQKLMILGLLMVAVSGWLGYFSVKADLILAEQEKEALSIPHPDVTWDEFSKLKVEVYNLNEQVGLMLDAVSANTKNLSDLVENTRTLQLEAYSGLSANRRRLDLLEEQMREE